MLKKLVVYREAKEEEKEWQSLGEEEELQGRCQQCAPSTKDLFYPMAKKKCGCSRQREQEDCDDALEMEYTTERVPEESTEQKLDQKLVLSLA